MKRHVLTPLPSTFSTSVQSVETCLRSLLAEKEEKATQTDEDPSLLLEKERRELLATFESNAKQLNEVLRQMAGTSVAPGAFPAAEAASAAILNDIIDTISF